MLAFIRLDITQCFCKFDILCINLLLIYTLEDIKETATNTYSMLSTPPARTIAWAPGRPFAPTALIDRFRIFSSQARPIIPTIAFLLLGELHSHARWIICLRAAAESKTFLQIARTAALQTGVHCQPGSPSRIPSRLGAFVSVTFLNLKNLLSSNGFYQAISRKILKLHQRVKRYFLTRH